MTDARVARIESEVRGFLRASYPDIVLRAEYWTHDPSRIALYFIEEKFRGLYPRQRYHRLVHLIPADYYRTNLADSVWFELAPGERPEDLVDPDEELIAAIAPDVLGSLQESGFFAALDDLLCPVNSRSQPEPCTGDFLRAKQALQACGFEESDWSDVFHVLMGQGGFCDCEILYNAAEESRLKAQYWKAEQRGRSHEEHR
ncbi:MAG TPA: DUF2695 domain-containing protein [Candidatus Sulfotelmatobacter sp.]|nr:DUF2695 domain-containing protein [Candidatus Sulfotelmatobacter sp.]